jgi:hypothetical protein
MAEAASPAALAAVLEELHRKKDLGYRDAWRKRGELIGIFCNIARKYDRLQIGTSVLDPDAEESWIESAADLCLYTVKYVTWLIERHPDLRLASVEGDQADWSAEYGACVRSQGSRRVRQAAVQSSTRLGERLRCGR